jgi:very-short-patch-repair endonuclease
LVLDGYTVLRFTYSQVIHDWDAVERTIARAVASGAHLAS